MDVFMDVDDKDINGDMSLKPKPEDLSDKKVKEDDTPSWPSVYDSLSVMTDDALGPLSTSTSTSRVHLSSRKMVLCDSSDLIISNMKGIPTSWERPETRS
ncbi:hypothetical protein SCP_1502410 [Sparassis crispa]|uniref:Uncharacterized protein n=1 Tax=Sparassis crispa TaxID=139825 RepID=A0A401H4A0_9APHY|nr:hypothetical protein SCP_1502410 [Sparassis crispa]GBE89233.1 hypothetical protein SCP_1502410 [Sparassis crispa]